MRRLSRVLISSVSSRKAGMQKNYKVISVLKIPILNPQNHIIIVTEEHSPQVTLVSSWMSCFNTFLFVVSSVPVYNTIHVNVCTCMCLYIYICTCNFNRLLLYTINILLIWQCILHDSSYSKHTTKSNTQWSVAQHTLSQCTTHTIPTYTCKTIGEVECSFKGPCFIYTQMFSVCTTTIKSKKN